MNAKAGESSTQKITINENKPSQTRGEISAEYLLVRSLLQYVTRAFYGTKQIVLMDRLTRVVPFVESEDILATETNMQVKEIRATLQPLVNAHLIELHHRAEVKESNFKASNKGYYYVDCKRTVNTARWRMYKVRKSIDDRLRDEIQSQGYLCPRCKKSFTPFDVVTLGVSENNLLVCDNCGHELVDNETSAERQANQNQIRRLGEQTKDITDALRKTENVIMPAFDIVSWLEKNRPLPKIGADGLAIATGTAQATKVTVEIKGEANDAAEKQRLEVEAAAKRQANALPNWLSKSTVVTGISLNGLTAKTENDQINGDGDGLDSGDLEVEFDAAAYYAQLASTTAGNLAESVQSSSITNGKRAYHDSDAESTDLNSKKLKHYESDQTDVPEEAVSQAVALSGRTVTVGGVTYPLETIRADEDLYYPQMTPEEAEAYLDIEE